MIINDLDGYYIVFDTKNWNTELDTLISNPSFACKPHTPWARSFWAFSPFQPYSQNTFNLYRSK